jgi:hypothetical protein
LVHKLGRKCPWTTKELINIATSYASGEEAVRVIFDHARGKAKRDEDAGKGTSNRSKKKKRGKQRSRDLLVAAAEPKGKKAPAEGNLDHFEKMLEGPFPNHAFLVKHAYKDCGLMKKFLSEGSKKGDRKKKHDLLGDDAKEKEDIFLEATGCLMILVGRRRMTLSIGRSSHVMRCMRPSWPPPPSSDGQGPPLPSTALTVSTHR